MKKPHYLVLSEKPSLSRTVEDVYKKHKNEYDFTCDFMAFAGHLCALQEPGGYSEDWKQWNLDVLPMIPEKFEYVVGKGKTKLFNDIKNEIKKGKYDAIINNCDGDAEGQAIFHTNMMLMNPGVPFLRLWPHDLTEQEVDRAFKNLRDESEPALINLTHRALLRAQLDWLIGMNGSRAFAMTTRSKTVIGRVQTPTLKLIVERELEIRNFVPKEYFLLNATFKHGKDIYVSTYFNPDDDSLIFDKKVLEKIRKDLKDDAVIESVDKKKVTTYAPALFSLTTLQQEANIKLGFSAQETLNLAQSLYEQKLISYPRTESTCVTEAIAKTFKTLLNSLEGPVTKFTSKISAKDIKETSANKKYVNDKKVGSHYALIPTTEKTTGHSLSKKQKDLYDLIVKRFVAIFLPASVSEKTTIITNDNGYLFKTTGSIMVKLGYLELLGYSGSDAILPDVKEKDPVSLEDSEIISRFTTPPARYNDASLIKAMETAGKNISEEDLKEEMKGLSLGTPATRAGIIERLLNVKVVSKKGKVFIPTDLGIWQIETLGNQKIANVELTAEYEKKLSEVENGTKKPDVFRKEMVKYIETLTDDLKTLNGRGIEATTPEENKEITEACPKCGGKILENNKMFVCENEDFSVSKNILGATVDVTDLNLILAGKKTEEKTMLSKKKKKFNACIKLTDKKDAITFEFAESTPDEGTPLGVCPVCGKQVLTKEGKYGKYYTCENEKCSFKISSKIAGKAISETVAKQLITKRETNIIKGFTSKSKKKFNAKLKLDNKGNINFVFEQIKKD